MNSETSSLHKFGSVVAFIFNKAFMIAFVILILVFVPVIVIASSFTNPDKVKQILNEGDVYTTVVDNAVYIIETSSDAKNGTDQLNVDTKKTLGESLALNNVIEPKEFSNVIKNTFDREYLRSKLEPAIDSSYKYLNGDSQQLELSFTLNDRTDKFKSELKSYLVAQLKKLPKCTQAQAVSQLNKKDGANILEASCLPADANLEKEVDKAIADITKDGPFTKVYDQNELGLSKVDLNNAKTAYSTLEKLPTIFWVMFLLIAAAIVMTGKTTYQGFREVGIISFVAGILLMLEFAIIGSGNTITSRITDGDPTSPEGQAVLNIVQPLAESASTTIKTLGIEYGAIISIIGIACFGFAIFLKKHHYEHLQFPNFHHSDTLQPANAESNPKKLD